jgi:hypothetical protein
MGPQLEASVREKNKEEFGCPLDTSVSVKSIALTMNLDEKLPIDDGVAESGKDMWESYAAGENLFTNNGEGASRRIRALSKKLFSPEEKMKVDFLDVQSKFDHKGFWPKLANLN